MKLLAACVLNTTLLLACVTPVGARQAKPRTYEQSRTALMRASERGDLRTVRALLRKGADVNAKDTFGGTALMSAAGRGHLPVVSALLAAGADPNAKGATAHYGDFSVLVAALQPENKDWLRIVDALIVAGAEVNPSGTVGRFPLAHAVERRSALMLDALLRRGADVNFKNHAGMTALMAAVVGRSPEMVRHLLARGADAKARTNDGETALSLLRQMPGDDGEVREEIERLLKAAGADK
ncbi:MAG TPA: ankyrin repeat domain-containing protein [Pyrinomonadaceae bacterium]|nr:ankyrin repeat domain-containing protein [Pyrinomonadaceae bacterium]